MLRTMVYLSMKDGYRERDEVDWDCTHDIIEAQDSGMNIRQVTLDQVYI